MNNYLHQLIDYAKNENWESMDALIPKVCNEKDIIAWSLGVGVTEENDNVRDLAVSILEKSSYVLNEYDVQILEKLMQTDENIYVQFRAAFTLFNRDIHTRLVMNKIHEALSDNDVKEIAAGYLGIKI